VQSLQAIYLQQLRLTAEDGSTLNVLGEFRGRQELFREQAPEVLEALLQAALIESTESSNRLEGITAPRERLEALVLRPTAPENRSEQEIAGYRDALNLIHESHRDMAFSVNVILQLHAMLFRYTSGSGGRWKTSQNEIIERSREGKVRVRFTPVSPVATPGAMDQLVKRYAAAVERGREPLVVVPLAILDFLCIHPFADGNGRMARLLTLLMLYHFGYTVGRYISLERTFEELKDRYYDTLELSSEGWHEGSHDVAPWMTYFWVVLHRAYMEFEARVGTIRSGRGWKTELVERAIARRTQPFGIAELEPECPGVSREMVRYVLRQYRDAGRLEVQGQGRGSRWVPTGR
jgi:Fic family protein